MTRIRPGIPLLIAAILLLQPVPAFSTDGFFTVGFDGSRWWLYDPDGAPFYSSGVTCVTPDGYYCPDLGYSPYHENIMDLYGSEEAWADVTLARLRDWGFNTLGAWSDPSLFSGEIAYTTALNLSGADWEEGTVPDYFGDEFHEHAESVVAEVVPPLVDDPYLLGYFFDNELRWGADWRGHRDLFAVYFSFEPDAPGKIELVEFLRSRYNNNVKWFNLRWLTLIRSFDDLYDMRWTPPLPVTPAQERDRADFAGHVAAHYFSYCNETVRAADPNHLILGSRFVSWITPATVVEASAPYCDVVSVNHYEVWPIWASMIASLGGGLRWTDPGGMLAEYHALTGRPVLVSETSVRAFDSGLPNTYPYPWFFVTLNYQEGRADFFEDFARASFAADYKVGYHWFSYMDEPPLGRFDGENSNFGLVSNEDEPWEPLVSRMREVNPLVYDR